MKRPRILELVSVALSPLAAALNATPPLSDATSPADAPNRKRLMADILLLLSSLTGKTEEQTIYVWHSLETSIDRYIQYSE